MRILDPHLQGRGGREVTPDILPLPGVSPPWTLTDELLRFRLSHRAPSLRADAAQDLTANLSVKELVAVNIDVEEALLQVAHLLAGQRSDAPRLGAA